MREKEYPWLRLSHRLRELPGIFWSLLAGTEQRDRLMKIIKGREEQRAELEERKRT